MYITSRAYQGAHDLGLMAALVRSYPAENFHIVDLPFRFSSWAFDNPENVQLWFNDQGELIAWAVLQTPFWAIDYAYHPEAPTEIRHGILEWADARAQAVRGTSMGRPMWFVNVFDWQAERQRDLETFGFASQADVGEYSWTKVLLKYSATHASDVTRPSGFCIRPLAGADEVEAYVQLHRSVFESESMTVEWRKRTLAHPDYQPDLDLVVVAPDGRLAGFCVCWFTLNGIDGEPSGQIEPLGVYADFRRHGLGRALIAEGLRRLHQLGATQIVVETDNDRNAALLAYEAAGFRVEHNVLVYRKDYF